MPDYRYKVRTADGELREGTLAASSLAAAVQGLQEQRYIVVSVAPVEASWSALSALSMSFDHVRERDVVIVARQLSTLLDAKVPVVHAIRTLAEETERAPLRVELAGLADDIEGGMAMSAAMEQHSHLFSNFFVNMVRSGEESGKVDEVLLFLADYLERSHQLRTKVRNALIYPAFVLAAFVGVMVLLLTVIVPNIAEIFEETAIDLPIYTRAVIAIGNFAASYWIVLFVLLALSGAFLWRYVMTIAGHRAWARLFITFPIVGPLARKFYMARLSDNLETLLSAGVPVIRSLEITANVVGNDVYREIINEAAEAVKGGSTIANALGKYNEIPPLVTQMIRVGEETGKLDAILHSLSKFYQNEVTNLVDNLVTLIEPLLIVVLGLGVGILVAAVLLPLYSLTGAF